MLCRPWHPGYLGRHRHPSQQAATQLVKPIWDLNPNQPLVTLPTEGKGTAQVLAGSTHQLSKSPAQPHQAR